MNIVNWPDSSFEINGSKCAKSVLISGCCGKNVGIEIWHTDTNEPPMAIILTKEEFREFLRLGINFFNSYINE